MKLKLKSSNSKSKTSNKNTKAEAKKKQKEDNLYRSRKYTLTECFKFAETDVTLNNLTYGHIINADVSRINLSGDMLDIDSSWVGLILIMLDTLRINSKDEKEVRRREKHYCIVRKGSSDDIEYVFNFRSCKSYIWRIYNL